MKFIENKKSNTILPLYIPLAVTYACSSMAIVSFFIAWFGSFFIFYWTWFSPSSYIEKDLPISGQLMRPIFLLQAVFAGFMCCTSIFFFLDHLGYEYFNRTNNFIFHENTLTHSIAQCQRLGLLAHVGLVTGIIWNTKNQKNQINKKKHYNLTVASDFLIGFSIILFAFGFVSQRINGLSQIAIIFNVIAICAGTLLFVKGLVAGNIRFLGFGAFIFISNFLNSTLSGNKEPVIVNILLLFVLLFPYAKRTISILAIPVFYLMLYILPTYSSIVRKSWSGEITAEAARTEAVDLILDESAEDELQDNNWRFLTNRLSEISMFTQFVEYVPNQHDYYGWEIFNQSITVLIPRVFWPGKPNIETVSMERVYDAGVANRLSNVSAKTRPIVDAYVSWGTVGVFAFMLAYGLLAKWLNNECERLYGGYELGCIVMFNSLFQTMWRGNNFEFMFSNIFYGAVLMYLIHYIMKTMRIVQPLFFKIPDLPRRPNPFVRKAKISDFR